MSATLRWLALGAAVTLLDQATKQLVSRMLAAGEAVTVAPFFDLVHVRNPGAAFSFLSDAPGWQRELFIAIALAAIVWIVYLLHKHARETLFCLALALILGGAAGNLIDRVAFGAVIDFLDFHLGGHHWPAFNAADSAITCGAALLIWDSLRRPAADRDRAGTA